MGGARFTRVAGGTFHLRGFLEVEDTLFTGVQIIGPARLRIYSGGVITSCTFKDLPSADHAPIVSMNNCSFSDCYFEGVSILLKPRTFVNCAVCGVKEARDDIDYLCLSCRAAMYSPDA